MSKYIILDIVYVLTPFLGNALSMLTGIIIANIFWKARIYRYASATILKTMEFQSNKIEHLEQEIIDKKDIVSSLRGSLKVAKTSALKIIEVTEL